MACSRSEQDKTKFIQQESARDCFLEIFISKYRGVSGLEQNLETE
jgi:hypothetical protein